MNSPDSYQHPQAVLPILDTELVQHVHRQYGSGLSSIRHDFAAKMRQFNPVLHDIVEDLPYSFLVPPPLHEVAVGQAAMAYGLLHRQGYSNAAVARFNRRTGDELTTADLPPAFSQKHLSLAALALRATARAARSRARAIEQLALPMVVNPHVPKELSQIDVRHARSIVAQHDPHLGVIVDGGYEGLFEFDAPMDITPQHRLAIGNVTLAMYQLLDTAERSSTYADGQ